MRDLDTLEKKANEAFRAFEAIAGTKAAFEMKGLNWPEASQAELVRAWESFQDAEEEFEDLYHIINR